MCIYSRLKCNFSTLLMVIFYIYTSTHGNDAKLETLH